MEIIGSTRLRNEYRFFEAHYLYFILDLQSRLDENVQPCRPGLDMVTKDNASKYVEFMDQFVVSSQELKREFETSSDQMFDISDFLPTVLIDFDNLAYITSHPDSYYLNFEGYLPQGWDFKRVDNVYMLIPSAQAYWSNWKCLN